MSAGRWRVRAHKDDYDHDKSWMLARRTLATARAALAFEILDGLAAEKENSAAKQRPICKIAQGPRRSTNEHDIVNMLGFHHLVFQDLGQADLDFDWTLASRSQPVIQPPAFCTGAMARPKSSAADSSNSVRVTTWIVQQQSRAPQTPKTTAHIISPANPV